MEYRQLQEEQEGNSSEMSPMGASAPPAGGGQGPVRASVAQAYQPLEGHGHAMAANHIATQAITIPCAHCGITMQVPGNTNAVQCPRCQRRTTLRIMTPANLPPQLQAAIRQAQSQLAPQQNSAPSGSMMGLCSGCRVTLHFPPGSSLVRCSQCNAVSDFSSMSGAARPPQPRPAVNVECPECHMKLQAPPQSSQQMQCPGCSSVFSVPTGQQPAAAHPAGDCDRVHAPVKQSAPLPEPRGGGEPRDGPQPSAVVMESRPGMRRASDLNIGAGGAGGGAATGDLLDLNDVNPVVPLAGVDVGGNAQGGAGGAAMT